MAIINTLYVRLRTKNTIDGGTHGDVYAGIGGREFYIDSGLPDEDYDDFEAGDDRIYILGEKPSLIPSNSTLNIRPDHSDPRKPYALRTENLGRYPVYIRYEDPNFGTVPDFWALEYAEITVNPVAENIIFSALGGDDYLWLTHRWGNIVYLSLSPRETVRK